jgi:hypothetical protein
MSRGRCQRRCPGCRLPCGARRSGRGAAAGRSGRRWVSRARGSAVRRDPLSRRGCGRRSRPRCDHRLGAPWPAGRGAGGGVLSQRRRRRVAAGFRPHRRRARRLPLSRPPRCLLPVPRSRTPWAGTQRCRWGSLGSSDPHRKNVRRRPTLPRSRPRSTIGAEGLSFRVRDGTGRFPFAMAAETLWRCRSRIDRTSGTAQWTRTRSPTSRQGEFVASPRPISTGQLHALPHFHFRPINPMVYSGALLHKGWETSS